MVKMLKKRLGSSYPWIILLFAIGIFFIDNEWFVSSPRAASPEYTNADIVKSFFPQKLRDESEQDFISGGPEPSEFFDFELGDLENTGSKDFIVAAYTNGFSGVIRVLRKRGDSFILADEPDLPLLGGVLPKVKLLNLDTEPRPEVIVSFSSARGPSSDWVFRWDGNTLNLVGPTITDENGDTSTILSEADFVDLDGDGVMEIVNPSSLDDNQIYQVYKINGSQVKTLNFFGTFIRNSAKPIANTRTFSVAIVDTPYLLHVVNGNGKKDSLVSSAVIKLNEDVVAGPQQFNKNKSGFIIPISLLSNNTLNVDLQSKPGSQITIFIEPKP